MYRRCVYFQQSTAQVVLTSLAALIILLSAARTGRADVVTFYTDRVAWEAAAPALTNIDFSGYAAPSGSADFSSLAGLTVSGVNFRGMTDQQDFLLVLDGGFCCPTYQDRGQVASLTWPAATSAEAGANGRLVITLPAGITAVGMDLFEVQPGDFNGVTTDTINMTLSDGFTSSVVTLPAPDLVFLGFTSNAPIASITMTGTSPEDFPDMANFAFGPTAVPEPASLAMLAGAVLFTLIFAGRRRLST